MLYVPIIRDEERSAQLRLSPHRDTHGVARTQQRSCPFRNHIVSGFGRKTRHDREAKHEEWCTHRFFFLAEDGIRDGRVTGVQTCALPISPACGCRKLKLRTLEVLKVLRTFPP